MHVPYARGNGTGGLRWFISKSLRLQAQRYRACRRAAWMFKVVVRVMAHESHTPIFLWLFLLWGYKIDDQEYARINSYIAGKQYTQSIYTDLEERKNVKNKIMRKKAYRQWRRG